MHQVVQELQGYYPVRKQLIGLFHQDMKRTFNNIKFSACDTFSYGTLELRMLSHD